MPLELPSRLNVAEYFVFRPAREHPGRLAILGEPRPVTYGQLAELTARVAGALASSGCAPGARVLLVLPDSLEFIASFFAAAAIGAVAVPVNAAARQADYAYYLADSGARIAIVHAGSLDSVLGATGTAGLDLLVVAGGCAPGSAWFAARAWDDWLAAAPAAGPAPTAAGDTAFFLYTSGSGGTPKAAIHRHQDMYVTSRCYASDVLGLGPDDRTFSVSKLFFAYGLGNAMYFPLGAGASTILYPGRPRPEPVAEIVARFRPTVFYAVPTFYAAFLRRAGAGLPVDFSSVRLAVSAGEPLPEEIFLRFRDRFGLEILDGIGSTEMLHMFLSPQPGRTRPATCGFEVPQYGAKIVDEEGRPVSEGAIGNLWVRGASAFSGYWNKPELTAQAKRGDWVVTGDKFFRDPDGFYHYCGRSDDMLKVGGMWVAPAEVENALLAHPSVAEAAVVGRLFDGLTRAVAYVVLRESQAGSEDLARSLREFVRERLPSFKAPAEVHFLAELPKTATGKIQRFKLRQS
ncbi:MAG TPA: benzoate-CoA ligase family protein [Candidatus Acidoferrales bacterium]|nr:benzoate-CoA ligase family protein [Candidatus Acidoferrales bacterium]